MQGSMSVGDPQSPEWLFKTTKQSPIIVDIRELRSGLYGNKTHIPTPVLAGAP